MWTKTCASVMQNSHVRHFQFKKSVSRVPCPQSSSWPRFSSGGAGTRLFPIRPFGKTKNKFMQCAFISSQINAFAERFMFSYSESLVNRPLSASSCNKHRHTPSHDNRLHLRQKTGDAAGPNRCAGAQKLDGKRGLDFAREACDCNLDIIPR